MSQERDQAYFDIFTTAIEGGINYWASVDDYHIWLNGEEGVEDLRGFSVTLYDEGSPLDKSDAVPDGATVTESPTGWRLATFKVNRATIAKGVRLFIENRDGSRIKWGDEYADRAAKDLRKGNWDDLDIDADLADRIVQLGLFGKIIYG